MKIETHKGLKCITLICLLCPMLVIIHFESTIFGKKRKDGWPIKLRKQRDVIPQRTISCLKASLPPQKEN